MKVVLLERVENLGAIGDVVSVKDGFARNFLLPRDKARRATSANLKAFELDRAAIEPLPAAAGADAAAQKIDHVGDQPLQFAARERWRTARRAPDHDWIACQRKAGERG